MAGNRDSCKALAGFVKFTQQGRKHSDPFISIRKNSEIAFSAAAVNLYSLDIFEAAVLYMSVDLKQIGIRLTIDGDEEGAISLKKRKGNFSICARSFLNKYNVDRSETRSFKFQWVPDHHVAIFFLNQRQDAEREKNYALNNEGKT